MADWNTVQPIQTHIMQGAPARRFPHWRTTSLG
jgi:hypothetical protein